MKKIVAIALLVTGFAGNVFVYGQSRVRDSVRIMQPDRMPCRILSFEGVEKMPVAPMWKGRPADRMPNGAGDGRPHVMIIPKKGAE